MFYFVLTHVLQPNLKYGYGLRGKYLLVEFCTQI